MIRDSLLDDSNPKPAHMKRLKDFKVCKGWLLSFAERYDLQSMKLSGEDGSVNAAAVAQDIINFCKRLGQYGF